MTDSLKVQACKKTIKSTINENYLPFMQDLSCGVQTIDDLANKWDVKVGLLRSWIKTIGYRTGGDRQSIRSYNKAVKRIKERQKRNKMLINYLMKINS